MSLSWSIKAASVAGTRHRQNGEGCQDAFFVQQPCKGLLVAAVADGAGSARHSAIAARVASKCAVEWLVREQERLLSFTEDDDWSGLFDAAISAAVEAVNSESKRQDIAISELSTTLILVVARPDLVVSAQIGDGVVILSDTQGNLVALTSPQHGEYRNDTVFLHSRTAVERTQTYLCAAQPSNLAIMTDGLELLALNLRDGSPHAPFFDPLWKFANREQGESDANAQLEAFLRSDRIASRTDDDLTLVLGHLKEENK